MYIKMQTHNNKSLIYMHKAVLVWLSFPSLSLRLCWIHIETWVLLRGRFSVKALCSYFAFPCRFLRVKRRCRKRWASSRSSTALESSTSKRASRRKRKSTAGRRRRWWSRGGLAATNQQPLTAACVATLCSKASRGEQTCRVLMGVFSAHFIVTFSYRVALCLTLHVCVFSSVAGQEDCWLLTETLMQTATLQLKVCLNVQCLALHSFTDLHPGKWKHLKKATLFKQIVFILIIILCFLVGTCWTISYLLSMFLWLTKRGR